VVPCSRLLLQAVEGTRLLQAIEGLVESRHQLRVCRVNEVGGLRAVDSLRECAMEEGVLDVDLGHGPTPGDSQSQHSPDGGRLDDGVKGLIVVHPGALSEPLKDPMSLVPVKRAIRLKLVLEDLLAGDDIGPRRPMNQVPRAVRQQSLVLLHSVTLVGVCKRATNRARDRRQCQGSGDGELKMIHRLGDPGSTTSDHCVGVAGVTSHSDGVVDRRPGAGV
jgi:hypothetical protein